jgi:hypothetical protein
MSHPAYTLLFALMLSTALALLGNRSPSERLSVAAYVFLCCAAGTVLGSWGMYLIHG